jgi:hypothetical protein
VQQQAGGAVVKGPQAAGGAKDGGSKSLMRLPGTRLGSFFSTTYIRIETSVVVIGTLLLFAVEKVGNPILFVVIFPWRSTTRSTALLAAGRRRFRYFLLLHGRWIRENSTEYHRLD